MEHAHLYLLVLHLLFIRMDQNFRMVFLFQGTSLWFMQEFSERKPRMQEFLTGLRDCAAQLESMNKGAKISSVVGSSVGLVGGVLSIVGLALIPVTLGVSVGLTMAGVGLGVTSGVNSMVTTATEMGVNSTEQKKAKDLFQKFMEDVQVLQECLEVLTNIEPEVIDTAIGAANLVFKAGAVGKGIDAIADLASAAKILKNEEVVAAAAKVAVQEGKALRNVPRVAADIPDIGGAAIKGPLALGRGARAGLIAVNALFIGMDIFFIAKDSVGLAKGSETEISQFIKAREALWSSEMDSWQKIHDSLSQGLEKYDEYHAVLNKSF